MVFVDSIIIQALDTNHSQVRLESDKEYELYIYLYNGSVHGQFGLKTELSEVDEEIENLYYDMYVPYLACANVYTKSSFEYTNTLKALNVAANILQFNYPYNEYYFIFSKT